MLTDIPSGMMSAVQMPLLSFPSTGTKPIVKWAGGKRNFVERLRPYVDRYPDARWVEPFAGGAALALAFAPRQALLNDINPHLINLYRHVGRGVRWNDDASIVFANDSDVYYAQRARFNELIKTPRGVASREAALLFWYLNRTCFNGLCRFNRSGGFNTAFGKYREIDYAALAAWREAANLFDSWQLECGDFSSLSLRPHDLVYADPPYDIAGDDADQTDGSSGFTAYSKDAFGWAEQVDLAEWLHAHSGPVIASNSATPRIVALYTRIGFTIEYISVRRFISGNGTRNKAQEMLAFKGF